MNEVDKRVDDQNQKHKSDKELEEAVLLLAECMAELKEAVGLLRETKHLSLTDMYCGPNDWRQRRDRFIVRVDGHTTKGNSGTP